METGHPILNVMSFPFGKRQQYAVPPPSQLQKKKEKKSDHHRHERKQKSININNNHPTTINHKTSAAYPPPSRGSEVVDRDRDREFIGEYNPKDNIEVIVRIRPRNNRERVKTARTVLKILEGNTLIFDQKEDQEEFYFHGVKQKVHDCAKRPNKDMRFSFDHVYGPRRSNVEIFEETLKSIVNHIICGFSCSVFAYGATGSGKTYTMLGSHGNPGLTFLVAMELYRRISEMANEYESEVVVSYLEIYNESLRDLLRPSGILNIREDGLHGVNIPNLTTHRPKDPSEMLELLSSGNSARTQHPTDHNAESSRSHAVFQVSVTMRRRFTHVCLNYNMAKAKLVMVDLAGSERGSMGCSGEASRHREGANINKSLLALGNCINALADGKKHVPYRDSKLTRLLKDSLGGNCKTVMIANLAPTSLTYDDTYNTLKYADRAKQIRVHCKKNISTDDASGQLYSKIISDLQMEILGLKALLLKERESCHNQSIVAAPLLQRELLGDSGFGRGVGKKKLSSSCTIGSPFISRTQVIADPAALENFIQLLSRKKKLDEALVKASVKAKEADWKLKWKNWRIEAVSNFSKGDLDSNNCLALERLRCLRSQYDNLYINNEAYKEKVEYAKRVFNFNRKEIDVMSKNFLSTLKMDEPFLTVTLSEFLYYKALEREVGTRKCIENYYQQMCSVIFEEMLRSETILAKSLNYLKMLRKDNVKSSRKSHSNSNPERENKYNEIVAKLYGEQTPVKFSLSNLKEKGGEGDYVVIEETDFPTMTSVQELINFIRTPIVEYEPPATTGLADDSQSAESGIAKGNEAVKMESLMAAPDNGLNVTESSSSLEYSTTGSTVKVSSDDQEPEQGWVTKSSSTTTVDVHESTCHLMRNLINGNQLSAATESKSSESKSSGPFTDLSKTSLNIKSVTTKKPGPSPTSAIPLKSVPASTTISLKETPQTRREKSKKPIPNGNVNAGTDILVSRKGSPPEPKKKTEKRDRQKHSSLKTKFTVL